jgi:hypothetical protein
MLRQFGATLSETSSSAMTAAIPSVLKSLTRISLLVVFHCGFSILDGKRTGDCLETEAAE